MIGIDVYNSKKELLEKFKEITHCGGICSYKPKHNKFINGTRIMYRWQLRSPTNPKRKGFPYLALNFYKIIEPYLITKKVNLT